MKIDHRCFHLIFHIFSGHFCRVNLYLVVKVFEHFQESIVMSRLLILHFGQTTQRLKFFPQGTRDDLLSGIREVLGLPCESPLRFRDGDGDIVVISPIGLPSGIQLHVEIEEGLPFQGTISSAIVRTEVSNAVVTNSWIRWDRSDGGGVISKDGLTFSVDDDLTAWLVFSPTLPISGRHYFTVEVHHRRPCCAVFGVVPTSVSSIPMTHLMEQSKYLRQFPFLVSLMGLGNGPKAALWSSSTGEAGMVIG